MDTPLTHQEIETALSQLPAWTLEAAGLSKAFSFPTFRDALAFMVRVGFEAEEMNHHPNWTNVYNRVTIQLSTHDAGDRVTAKDAKLAKRIEEILAARTA